MLTYSVFYCVGARARWCVLLAASFVFYATLEVPYLPVVLLLVTITTYVFGLWIDRANSDTSKRYVLWGGIATNVLILVALKYLPFLSENLNALSSLLSLDTSIQPVKALVAIGVSFYVFQAISYLSDIYLEIEKPERHLGYFSLYMAFFPKLLQGPIERTGEFLPQLKTKYEFDYDNMRFGMLLFACGLFKKVVIADRLGQYVDPVYNDVHAFSGMTLLLATYAYAVQIYMDFSGYTDMAIGSARLFNINLAQNFNSPYLATTVADFWRRWHMSFSRWILDYIFKPLQMSWRNWHNIGTALALLVTFTVSGLWHGATWSFIIWGMLHGLYLACSVFYKPIKKKIYKFMGLEKSKFMKLWQVFVTFHLVCFAWIFFRASTFSDALYVVNNVFVSNPSPSFGLSLRDSAILLFGMSAVISYEFFKSSQLEAELAKLNLVARWAIYNVLALSITFFGTCDTSKFIYFRF